MAGEQQQINLGQMVGGDGRYELSVTNESPEDAAARRLRESADATLKRRMSLGLFIFAMILASVVFSGCVYVFAAGSADDKKWAAGIVSAITSGLVGFMVGQARR
jgi:hypothetical protein